MLVRVRHVAGTWRVEADGGDTLAGMRRKIAEKHGIAVEEQGQLTLDQAGKERATSEEQTLDEIGVKHGDMIFLHEVEEEEEEEEKKEEEQSQLTVPHQILVFSAL